MKIIKNQIKGKLKKLEKINDRLIYIADIYIDIHKKKIRSKNKKKYVVREERNEILRNQVYESKPKKLNEEYFIKECKRKVDLHKEETMEITRIVLKKEIGCSIYE